MNVRLLCYQLKNCRRPRRLRLNIKGRGTLILLHVPLKWHSLTRAIIIINGEQVILIGQIMSAFISIFMEQFFGCSNSDLSNEEYDLAFEVAISQARKIFGKSMEEERLKTGRDFIESLWKISKGEEYRVYPIRNYAKSLKAPYSMDLLVSSMNRGNEWNCNQNCPHCYSAWQHEGGKEELSTLGWMNILDKLRRIGVSKVTFSGGEPTLRKDIPELIKYAKLVTCLSTNGRKLTYDYCYELSKAHLDSIQITLYSADKKIHNFLVGMPDTNCWQETIAGIKNALKVGIEVTVNTPLCSFNKDYVSLLKLLKGIGVSNVSCSGIIVAGGATIINYQDIRLCRLEITSIVVEAKEYCLANGLHLKFTTPGEIDEEELKKIGLEVPTCHACISEMAISPDGTVIPCHSWLDGSPLGNILQLSWRKIWNNVRCKKIRSIAAKECLINERCEYFTE